MRQSPTVADEPFLMVRSLSIDYASGARVEGHSHGWPQLLYARSGCIRAEVGGAYWIVPPRRAIWIPAETGHLLEMEGRVCLRTLYFGPGIGADMPTVVRAITVCGLLHEAILRICDRGACDRRDASDRRLAELVADEIGSAEAFSLVLAMPSDSRARRLAGSFLDRERNRASVTALLRDAGLSRRTAERLFAAETGVSPARWRRMACLAHGLERLIAGRSVESAMSAAGYESRSAFTSAFRGLFGESPASLARREQG